MKFGLLIFTMTCLILLCCIPPSPAETYMDAMGRTITLDKPPRRIVSMAPSLTEILFFLGLKNCVVGVTQFSCYPPEAEQKPKIGSYINLNVERIVTLNPDLAVGTADGNKEGVVKHLEQAGIPVYIVNPRSVSDAIDTVAILGGVCGIGDKGMELASLLKSRVDYVLEKTAALRRPSVFLQINIKPIMTVNRNTFHHDLIRLAGGRNISSDMTTFYPRISIEEVLQKKPEIIIISSMERGGRFAWALGEWLKWPVIPAVKEGRVHLIDSDLLDRPSPRIVKGLETLARLIHPEVEWDIKDVK